MEDEIVNVTEEVNDVVVDYKGKKFPTKAKTIYTYYKSGRKDCAVIVETPIELGGVQVPLQGGE